MKLKAVLRDKSLHLAAISLLAAQVIPNIAWAQAQPAPPLSGVLGKVQSFTGSSLDVATPSGVVHVTVTQPLATYKQIPSDLSHVTSNSYVGVASDCSRRTAQNSRSRSSSFPRNCVERRKVVF